MSEPESRGFLPPHPTRTRLDGQLRRWAQALRAGDRSAMDHARRVALTGLPTARPSGHGQPTRNNPNRIDRMVGPRTDPDGRAVDAAIEAAAAAEAEWGGNWADRGWDLGHFRSLAALVAQRMAAEGRGDLIEPPPPIEV